MAEVVLTSLPSDAEEVERYARILEAVDSYAYSVETQNGRYASTWHSPGCVAVTGYTPTEYASDPDLWIGMVHPADRDKVRQHADRALANAEAPSIEHRIHRKDGTLRWVENAIVRQCSENGQLIGYDGLVKDVTRQRHMEHRFQRLFESGPDAMVIVDGEGRIDLANARAERMFGYTRRELLGQGVEVLVPERLRGKHLNQRLGYTENPHTRPMGAHGELYGLHKDGSEFPAEISISPIGGQDEIEFCAAIRDITERKGMQRKLGEQEAQLLAAREIQEHLLPDAPPRLPGFEIAGACYPAEFAAGDYYDFIPLQDESVGIVVADVSGHGIGPALLAASTQAYVRSLAETASEIDKMLLRVNRSLIQNARNEHFVTLLLVQLDPLSRRLGYVNAGHPSSYVLDVSGRLTARLPSTGLPLGVDAEAVFPIGDSHQLNPGDVVLLLTDGLLEAMSPDGDSFGTDRLLDILSANRAKPAAEIITAIYRALQQFSGGVPLVDDVTLVVVKVDPNSATGH
jgi:sigma-B regulation protein RsbU (phosphoserine phosphatase)